MTIKEIIDGLKFTVDMFLFDTTTGETFTEPRNDMDKTTIDACKGAIELLEQTRWIPVSERFPEFGQDVLLSLRSLDIKTGFRAETEPYFYCHGVDGCYIEPQNVLAWMPLPEPYKAESEG